MNIYITQYLKNCGCKVLTDEYMRFHTTFKTGGAAEVLCECTSRETAEKAYRFLYENNIPFLVLGRCSNVLVSDKGYRGVILKFYGDYFIEENNDRIICSGGVNAKKAAEFAGSAGFTGAEFMGTIPGSIGGLVCMNAGCYGCEMKDIVLSVRGIIEDKTFHYNNDNCNFSYRNSLFSGKKCIILEVELKLNHGLVKDIKDEMHKLIVTRRNSQPVEFPSAGSVFKRQGNIMPAKLIEQAGLKGFKFGGAMVSLKHSGFIINNKDATSEDIYKLIQYVKEIIYNRFAVTLHEEILYIGEFNN